MAIRTRDELLESVRLIVGDSTDESTLTFMEDFTDTMTDYDNRANTDWQRRYEENDANWRQKYRDRFFGNPVEEKDVEEFEEKEKKKPKSFDDLFN